MEFVAFVGSDKENWGQVIALLKRVETKKKILVINKNVEGFPEENVEVIKIDCEQPILKLKKDLMEKLKKVLTGDFEVTLSLASGNGKEHMALIGALLSIPVGIKIVAYTKEGVQSIN